MKVRPEDYSIHNYMEDVADQAIDQVLSEDGTACDCPVCRDDVKSQMLNQLHHLYEPIIPGEPERAPMRLSLLGADLFNKVMIECYKALMKVKDNPRHDSNRRSLHNTTESIVRLGVSEILSNQKLFLERSDLSRLMAGALNGLKPSYTTTYKGDAFSRTSELDPRSLAKVYTQVFQALEGIQVRDRQTSQ